MSAAPSGRPSSAASITPSRSRCSRSALEPSTSSIVQFGLAHLHAHDERRHRAAGQRIERPDADAVGRIAGHLARRADAFGHGAQHVARDFGQRVRGVGGMQVAAFVAEQRAAHARLQRMKRAVHAHGADVEPLGRAREVARLHEGQEDLELAEGDLLVDADEHAAPCG